MYFDGDILSLRKNGRFAVVWLAATNKTLFRRHIKRGQCESIDIDDLCTSILNCANSNKPLILVAKLAYGAVYIYQQQVQFLYDKVCTAACNQTIAFNGIKKKLSSLDGNTPSSKRNAYTSVALGELYDDVLPGAALSTEAVISQLLASEKHTSVQRIDDITLRESENVALDVTVQTFLQVDNGFGEVQLNDALFESPPLANSTMHDTRNDSGIVEDTTVTGENVSNDLSQIVDQTVREASVEEPQLNSSSMAIIDMPIASTSVAFLEKENESSHGNTDVPAENTNTFEKSTCKHVGSNENAEVIENEHQPNVSVNLGGTEKEIPNCLTALNTPIRTAIGKRKTKQRLTIDKKTKLDADAMKRGMEDYNSTMRCTNSRYDVMPVTQIHYPFNQATVILQYPVRSTQSSLLPKLFTRNLRKRHTEIEDILASEWAQELTVFKRKRTEKELATDSPDKGNPTENSLKIKQEKTFDVIAQLPSIVTVTAETAQLNPEVVPPIPEVVTSISEVIDPMLGIGLISGSLPLIDTPQGRLSSDAPKISEFNEENVLKILSEVWQTHQQPIPFKFLQKRFADRLDAACCFSSLLVLIAKQKLLVTKSETNEISAIKQGPKFS